MGDIQRVNHPDVINIKTTKGVECIYIGRKRSIFHWGNPFSHVKASLARVIVGSREEAVQCCEDWLEGVNWQLIEPTRRRWIVDHIHELRGKKVGCFCDPLLCHGTPLLVRANNPIWKPLDRYRSKTIGEH